MKDLLGREIAAGNYICYALTSGRSANLAVYKVTEVHEEFIKACKVVSSYGCGTWLLTLKDGRTVPRKYCKLVYKPGEGSYFEEMSEQEKVKLCAKTSVLKMPERVFILDGFVPELVQA